MGASLDCARCCRFRDTEGRCYTRLWTSLWIICGSIVRSRKFYTQEFRHCFVFIIANSLGKNEHCPRQRGSVGVDGSLAWFAHPPGRARRSGEKSAPGTNLLLGECGPARTGGRLFGGNRPSPWRATSRDATTLSFPAIGLLAGGRAETGGRPSGCFFTHCLLRYQFLAFCSDI